MKMRALGSTAVKVSALALGGNVFGWTIDEKTSFRILDAFSAAGGNLIDTADVYSAWVPGNRGGESETIIGKWFAQSGKRNQIILATKVGMALGAEKKGLSKAYIIRAVEESLTRLKTDYIDLYQSHLDDTQTPLADTLDAYASLIGQGKIRVIGASNYSAGRLREALRIAREKKLPTYQMLQPHYNLCDRAGFEGELKSVCQENGIGVLPYYSLASGFLTGKYRSPQDLKKSVRGAGVSKYLNERGFRILKALDEESETHGATPARVALAWLMARPTVVAPIASATDSKQLEDLLAATELRLDEKSMRRLDSASREAAEGEGG